MGRIVSEIFLRGVMKDEAPGTRREAPGAREKEDR
jgi:hypothetical protein